MSFGSKIPTYDSSTITKDFLVSFAYLEKIEIQVQKYADGDVKLTKMLPKLLSIVKSFNLNVELINKNTQKLDFPEFKSFEDYCHEKHFMPDAEASDKYDDEKTVFDFVQCQGLHEWNALQQLAYICPTLSQKITNVFDQLESFESFAKQHYLYHLATLTDTPLYKPKLLNIQEVETSPSSSMEATPVQSLSSSVMGDVVASTPSPSSTSDDTAVASDPALVVPVPVEIVSTTTPSSTADDTAVASDPALVVPVPVEIVSTTTPSSTADDSTAASDPTIIIEIPVESAREPMRDIVPIPTAASTLLSKILDTPFDISIVAEPTPSVATTIEANVIFNLGSGQSLGICCDPNWGAAPIACTKIGATGWSVQAPIGKEWKYVILLNGQVHKWEGGANRRYNAPSEPLALYARF